MTLDDPYRTNTVRTACSRIAQKNGNIRCGRRSCDTCGQPAAELFTGSHSAILNLFFGLDQDMATKWFYNWSSGLILGAFCTMIRASPVGAGLGAKFGRERRETNQNLNYNFCILAWLLLSYHAWLSARPGRRTSKEETFKEASFEASSVEATSVELGWAGPGMGVITRCQNGWSQQVIQGPGRGFIPGDMQRAQRCPVDLDGASGPKGQITCHRSAPFLYFPVFFGRPEIVDF